MTLLSLRHTFSKLRNGFLASGNVETICLWSLILLVAIILVQPHLMSGETIAVRSLEGSQRGFLVLRTLEGKTIAVGDQTQTVRGERVVSRLVFRFKDGSVDDETAVFSQRGNLRLISDHHIQKGPSFPHPMDVSI